MAEEFEWTIPARSVTPAERTLQELITKELQRADVFVLGVTPPGEYVKHWRVDVQGGGRNETAQAVLRGIAGVRNVRPSVVSGSIICFDVDDTD